jgi:hypothetical protein
MLARYTKKHIGDIHETFKNQQKASHQQNYGFQP